MAYRIKEVITHNGSTFYIEESTTWLFWRFWNTCRNPSFRYVSFPSIEEAKDYITELKKQFYKTKYHYL